MILILDACSISNMVNVFQDNSLLIGIKKCFKEVYITPEVIEEVTINKVNYLEFYKNRWNEMDEIYDNLSLNDYVYKDDKGKKDCVSFMTKFSSSKDLPFKTSNGEYYSSLLSLYISRLGVVEFADNVNKILFVTDDAKAEKAYKVLFSTNQIGNIIDSIDMLLILYLKSKITKTKVIKYIEGLFSLYNKDLNRLRFMLDGIDIKNKVNSRQRLITEELKQLLYDGNISELKTSLGNPRFKKYFAENKGVKICIQNLSESIYEKKIPSLKIRKYEVVNDLVWKV